MDPGPPPCWRQGKKGRRMEKMDEMCMCQSGEGGKEGGREG
jgi:hypothetical protein